MCRGKKPADAKKTKNEVKANQIEVLSQVGDEGNDTTGIGRVAEIVRATIDGTQSRNADLRMTVLDPGQAAQPFTGHCCQRRTGCGCKLVGPMGRPG